MNKIYSIKQYLVNKAFILSTIIQDFQTVNHSVISKIIN